MDILTYLMFSVARTYVFCVSKTALELSIEDAHVFIYIRFCWMHAIFLAETIGST